MRKLRVHYMDCNDDEVLAELDVEKYVRMISDSTVGCSPSVFATALDAMLTVTNTDPRMSELDNTDVFISFYDVKSGRTSPATLFSEIPDEFANHAVNDLGTAETKN